MKHFLVNVLKMLGRARKKCGYYEGIVEPDTCQIMEQGCRRIWACHNTGELEAYVPHQMGLYVPFMRVWPQ